MKYARTLSRDEMKNVMAGNANLSVSGSDCRPSSTCGYCEEKNNGVWQCSTCCVAAHFEDQ